MVYQPSSSYLFLLSILGRAEEGVELTKAMLALIAAPLVGLTGPTAAMPSVATVELDPTRTEAGKPVDVSGSGFGDCLADATLRLVWVDTEIVVGTTTISATGTFATTFTVPAGATPERHEVTASCPDATGDDVGPQRVVSGAAFLQVVETVPPTTTTVPPTTTAPARTTTAAPRTTTAPPATSTAPPSTAAPPGPSDGGAVTSVLGGLLALLLAAVVVPALRRLRARPATATPQPTPARAPLVDAVLVGSGGPPPQLRETGADRTVTVRVLAHGTPGINTVQWREEGGGV